MTNLRYSGTFLLISFSFESTYYFSVNCVRLYYTAVTSSPC